MVKRRSITDSSQGVTTKQRNVHSCAMQANYQRMFSRSIFITRSTTEPVV